MSEDTVYRFVFEEGGDGDSPAPSARPGRAEAARRESVDRQDGPATRRGGRSDSQGGSPSDRPATVGDILRILQKGFGSTPVIGRLAQVGGQIIAPLVDMVTALRELRKILTANTAATSKATTAGAATGAGRTTVRGYRVVPGEAEKAREAAASSPSTDYERFTQMMLRAQRARESRMLTIDAESRPAGPPQPPGTSLGPQRNFPPASINRLPAVAGPQGMAAGRAAASAQPITATAAGGGAMAAGAVVAGAAAAVVVALGTSVVATKALIGRANELSKRLEGYSGQLAASQARAEIARLQQNVASARKLGGDLARYNDAKSRGEIALEKIYDSFTKAGLEAITPLLETAIKWLEAIAKHSDKIAEGAAEGASLAARVIPGVAVLQDLKAIVDRFSKQQEKKTDDEKRQAGSFEVLIGNVPDIDINDEATPAAKLTRQNVEFGGLGGAQVEMP